MVVTLTLTAVKRRGPKLQLTSSHDTTWPCRVIGAAAGLNLATAGAAQSSGIRTYCNPIDIDYKYNFEQLNEGISYRSGADPVIVNHKGEYYLFVTVSGGYWHSKDLLHWRFVTPSRWPFEEIVALAALSVGDTLLLMMSSFSQRPILYSTEPATGGQPPPPLLREVPPDQPDAEYQDYTED